MVYESYYIKAQASGGGTTPVGATLMKTGQTTSYRTGDDGDLEVGRATDFFTLDTNNPFGNTNRFTDELGGSTYANDIVIDWSTYDTVAGTVLGYYRVFVTSGLNWNDAIDTALSHSVGTFTTGWRLTNLYEILNIRNIENAYNYSPFNISISAQIWCSSNYITNAIIVNSSGEITVQPVSKTSTFTRRGMACRTFTVSGTTLT